jgi:hypothetical protein
LGRNQVVTPPDEDEIDAEGRILLAGFVDAVHIWRLQVAGQMNSSAAHWESRINQLQHPEADSLDGSGDPSRGRHKYFLRTAPISGELVYER